ncbi:unnamed protein product [Porites lobata]|uniref:Tryptophan 2,3-dioxygenase n=1 Tax=Porites lobata TaxID=104759 RepID=A0ABN8NME7_9CNID|nr:unnamed protein product [Porites lobata]
MNCSYYAHDLDGEASTQEGGHGDADKEVSYAGYLQLGKLLDCQKPRESTAHDELLFIIVHQVYELWFKEIIHELDSVMEIFETLDMEGRKMLVLSSRLNRILKIQNLLRDQVVIMETMTPMDFMKFRDHLVPASGFHSLQFRLIENKLGIKKDQRSKCKSQEYRSQFDSGDRKILKQSEEETSLLQRVQEWLERTPGLEIFWKKYKESIQDMLDAMEAEAKTLEEVNKQKNHFETILCEEKHNQRIARGERRFSHKAIQGALMIFFYRDEPGFSLPFQILQLLMDIDSLLLKWRYDHSMMAQRMIGSKVGTMGSSGYQYLKSTVSDRYKVFVDLFNLSNFFIPLDRIPELSSSIKEGLDPALLMNGNLNKDNSTLRSVNDKEDHVTSSDCQG